MSDPGPQEQEARSISQSRLVGLVLNPVSRGAAGVPDLLESVCRARGLAEPVALVTSVAEPGAGQTRELLARGVDLVLAAGGDGTVREAAGELAGTGVPLGIVPLGTANLFARNLALPLHAPGAALGVALDGLVRDLDAGWVRYRQVGPAGPVTSPEHLFLVVVGIGYDGETVAGTGPGLKRAAGWASYLVVGARHLPRSLHPVTITLDDGEPVRHRVWSVLVGNTGRIPLGIDLFPGSRPDDGLLDVARVSPRSALHWAPIALKGLLHWPGQVPGLHYGRARRVRVVATRPLTAQLDGEPHADVLELDVRVQGRALRVVGGRHTR